MKEIIPIPKSLNYFLLVFFAIPFIMVVYSSYYITKQTQAELMSLSISEIKGRIVELKELGRGNYSVGIAVRDSILICDLPIAFDVKKYKIMVGDSIYKEAESKMIDVLRGVNSDVHKICTLDPF